MIFCKIYLGDYTKKTEHLSIEEHGVYFLMMKTYYATEQPLPVGAELYRLLRASSAKERRAVDAVVAQFWTKSEAGLTNPRADEEISRASHQREVNRELGKRGGRPKKGASPLPAKTNGHAPAPLEPADPRKALWDLGISVLGEKGRSLIGQAIGRIGEAKVGEVLGFMATKRPAEPVSYFMAATKERSVVV